MRIRSHLVAAVFMIAASQAALADSALRRSLQQSIGKPAASSEQVVVVMQFNKAKNAKPGETAAAAQRMAAFLGQQPGYLDGQFLRNINSSGRPNFVHVTRWQSFADWERLFTTPTVLAAMDRESPFLSAVGSAFHPVKP